MKMVSHAIKTFEGVSYVMLRATAKFGQIREIMVSMVPGKYAGPL